jgi:MoaA/NifB/PqqE/SkfB family radical SAM enzyme
MINGEIKILGTVWIRGLWTGMTQSNNWYCKLPWTGFSNDPDGKARPCCLYKDYIKNDDGEVMYVQSSTVKEIFTSNYMKNLRQEFRDGKQPIGCSTCIIDEQNNYTSKRQRYNDQYSKEMPVNFDKEPEFPVEYQMILSNACNLKCRSCTPSHSSLWQAEHKVLWGNTGYKMPQGQSGENDSVLWNNREEWLPSVQRLEIVGGEPFYINRWKLLWEELIEKGLSKKVNMDISSNGTIYAGETVEKLVNNFRSIGLGLSIDGMGPMYEYLRHPGKWDEVESNLMQYHELAKKLDHKRFRTSISHTIGWLNAWNLPEFHTYIREETPRFVIWNNIIHYPTHMTLYMIPASLKKRIEEKWRAYDWKNYTKDVEGIINHMYSKQPSDEEIREAYKVFAKHDAVRNENLLSVIPAEILDEIRPFYE